MNAPKIEKLSISTAPTLRDQQVLEAAKPCAERFLPVFLTTHSTTSTAALNYLLIKE